MIRMIDVAGHLFMGHSPEKAKCLVYWKWVKHLLIAILHTTFGPLPVFLLIYVLTVFL